MVIVITAMVKVVLSAISRFVVEQLGFKFHAVHVCTCCKRPQCHQNTAGQFLGFRFRHVLVHFKPAGITH